MIREAFFDTQKKRVVFEFDARFEVDDAVGTANDRIVDDADGSPDDKARPEIMQVIGAKNEISGKFPAQPKIRLLHHRILQIVVDNIDARSARARQDKTDKRI